MALIVKAPEPMVKPAPEGAYGAVCVDVIDVGMITNEWGEKHCADVWWELDEVDEDGARFVIKKRYTLSLSEKSNLYKDLSAWRGRDFTEEELRGFDLESIVGKPCLIQVVRKVGSKGGTFANVRSVGALPKGVVPIAPSGNYTRRACAVPNGHDDE